MPEPLRRLFVGQRHGRIKKELGIDVGDALAYDFADTIAVTPPLFRIIIRVGDCYDTYRHVPAECLLIEKARSPRVGALRHNVDSIHRRVVTKPISQRDRRAVRSLPAIHVRWYHLNGFARNSSKVIARHRASDGKKRVALQTNTTKTVARLNPNTKKPRADNPLDTVAPAELPGPFVSTTRLNQMAGLRIDVALLQYQSPSLCLIGGFVLCFTARQRFLRQLAKKVSHRDVAFLDSRRAGR